MDIFSTYDKQFGLSGHPFNSTPDPSFFFESRAHGRALAHLRHAALDGDCFMVLTGDVGTGKTILLRRLAASLDGSGIAVAMPNATALDSERVLFGIVTAFRAPIGDGSLDSLRGRLQSFLSALARLGKRGLAIIDEAQHLHRDAIDELIELAKPQADGKPSLQVLVAGHSRLRANLPDAVRELREPTFLFCDIGPLNAAETRAYVEHRLHRVGWHGSPSFDAAAFARIFELSGGVPRAVNRLCHRVLMAAAQDRASAIDAHLVDAAHRAFQAEVGEIGGVPSGDALMSASAPMPDIELAVVRQRMRASVEASAPPAADASPRAERTNTAGASNDADGPATADVDALRPSLAHPDDVESLGRDGQQGTIASLFMRAAERVGDEISRAQIPPVAPAGGETQAPQQGDGARSTESPADPWTQAVAAKSTQQAGARSPEPSAAPSMEPVAGSREPVAPSTERAAPPRSMEPAEAATTDPRRPTIPEPPPAAVRKRRSAAFKRSSSAATTIPLDGIASMDSTPADAPPLEYHVLEPKELVDVPLNAAVEAPQSTASAESAAGQPPESAVARAFAPIDSEPPSAPSGDSATHPDSAETASHAAPKSDSAGDSHLVESSAPAPVESLSAFVESDDTRAPAHVPSAPAETAVDAPAELEEHARTDRAPPILATAVPADEPSISVPAVLEQESRGPGDAARAPTIAVDRLPDSDAAYLVPTPAHRRSGVGWLAPALAVLASGLFLGWMLYDEMRAPDVAPAAVEQNSDVGARDATPGTATAGTDAPARRGTAASNGASTPSASETSRASLPAAVATIAPPVTQTPVPDASPRATSAAPEPASPPFPAQSAASSTETASASTSPSVNAASTAAPSPAPVVRSRSGYAGRRSSHTSGATYAPVARAAPQRATRHTSSVRSTRGSMRQSLQDRRRLSSPPSTRRLESASTAPSGPPCTAAVAALGLCERPQTR